MYSVIFFSANHTSPIEEFLDNCSDSIRAKILKRLKYVSEFGLTPTIPNLRKIVGTPLWELRILGKDNIRIICSNFPNKEVVILHIFSKKKQKTPQKEIATAIRRLQTHIDK